MGLVDSAAHKCTGGRATRAVTCLLALHVIIFGRKNFSAQTIGFVGCWATKVVSHRFASRVSKATGEVPPRSPVMFWVEGIVGVLG